MNASSNGFVQKLDFIDNWLFESRAGAVALSLLFFAFTTATGLRFLDDEGTLPIEFISTFLNEPMAIFFLTKAKPVLLLIYGLPMMFGIRGYLFAHCLIGSAGVFLISEAARGFKVGRPNIAGLFLATSTIYFVSVAGGFPNADGVVMVALFLMLYTHDRTFLAGLVLGVLPLVRHELGVISVVFVAWDILRHRRIKMTLATVLLPALYLIVGAIYLGDLFWVFTNWLNTTNVPVEYREWRIFTVPEALTYHVLAFPNNSPLLTLAALAGIVIVIVKKRFDLLVFPIVVLLTVAMFLWLQTGTAIGFVDMKLRSYLMFAPFLAILAALALSFKFKGSLALLLVLTLATIVWQGVRLYDPVDIVGHQHEMQHQLFDELRERGLYSGQTLYTDLQTARYDTCAGIATDKTFMLANAVMRWEIDLSTKASDKQRLATVSGMAATRMLVYPEEHKIQKDALYLLRRQKRLQVWRDLIEAENPELIEVGDFDLYRWPANN
ncbi:MAG TPA: hypothetical protein PK329_03835 [Myxococcota bacterium]|nr:hypothetical protein [Myxococcota bacterium]HON26385.1 hypothetical protein [Myxococcota bacterium]HOS61996.1 hypothetical protein [Myxococcota bacterium]HPC91704.1 hypothetical protein [Myxococcota bacterium]HPL25587.1 hypothetical protein [Myxococcota bacterium]